MEHASHIVLEVEMTVRLKWTLAAPLVAVLASACVPDVTQEESAPFLRASFSTTTGTIPTPNDLALQAAVSLPATDPRRTALMAAITAGGLPGGAPSALNLVNVPFELVVEGAATTATSVCCDPASVNSHTVAIVKVRGTGAPAVLEPQLVATAVGSIRAFPRVGYEAGARYVAAVRGGASGVKTLDGKTIVASSPIYMIANGIDLSSPEKWPALLISPADASLLQTLQGLLANAVDWGAITNANTAGNGAATCRAVFGVPASAFVEGQCWVPLVNPLLPGFPGSPTTRSALAAVGLAFPVGEAISISTFEIAP